AVNVTVNAGGTTTAFVTSTTPGAARNDFVGWLGMKITVGASPVTVTALGRYMLSGNSQTHTVKLVNASTGLDVAGGSVSLSMSGGTAGQFKYATLGSSVTLAANTAYYLVSQEFPGGDQWYDDTTVVATTSVAVCTGPVLNNGSWTVRSPANTTFVPMSFKYSTGGDTTPATVSISSPTSGTTYTTAQTVTITASASDNVGVTKV